MKLEMVKNVLSDEVKVCACCGCVVDPDNAYVTPEGEILCEDCSFVCDDCYNVHRIDQRVVINAGTWKEHEVCTNCASRYYFCDECDRYFDDDFWNYSEGMCWECARRLRVIGDYHEGNPEGLVMHGNETFSYVRGRFGIELEVTSLDNSIARELLDCSSAQGYKDFHFESDCSVDGAEMIFQPRTIESWLEYLPTLEALLDILDSNGCTSEEGNGLHIHVSRSAFGTTRDEQNRRIVLFMQGFAGSNYNKMFRACGRKDYDEARQWSSDNGNETLSEKVCAVESRSLTRYRAVNVSNRNTVEVRLGGSTLSASRFISWLSVIATMVRRTESITTKEAKDFDQWFRDADSAVLQFLSGEGVDVHEPLRPIPEKRYAEIVNNMARWIQYVGQMVSETEERETMAHIVARIARCDDNELRVLGLK